MPPTVFPARKGMMAETSDTKPALRFNRNEAGGALGDLGTYIPLLVGMVNKCGLQLAPTLVIGGVMNVVTGLLFRIPMPVQPMKAIATVAIAEGMNEPQILVAGIITSLVLLMLAVTGLIDWLNRVIPKAVVRGLQLALGLKLLSGGIAMIADTEVMFGWDSIGLGILCSLLVLFFYFSRRVPGALVVLMIGVVALLFAHPDLLSRTRLGSAWTIPNLTSMSDWSEGFWRGALPQIPLTTLNSVIAVCALSLDLFPRSPAKPRRVALSVSIMNLIGCPLGAMPACHGAGGLAAQHRFGARTGGSIVMLGAAKIVLGLLFGGSLLLWLQAFPGSVLGVLLLFSGLELAIVCRDQTGKVDFFLMILTAGACLAVNTAVGFAVGWIMALLLLWGVFRIEKPSKEEGS